MSALAIAVTALFGLLVLTLSALARQARRERRRQDRERLLAWARGLALQALAWPALGVGFGYDWLPVVALGCGLLLAGHVEHGRVLERLLGLGATPKASRMAGPGLALLLAAMAIAGQPPARVFTALWLVVLPVSAWFAVRVGRGLRQRASEAERATVAVYAALAPIAAFRLLEQWLAPRGDWLAHALSPGQALVFGYMLMAPALTSVGYLLVHHERQRQRLEHAAASDPLTGLYNRNGFLKYATRLLRRARFTRMPVAVMMLDVDNFKQVNDSFGHAAGDAVLLAIARRLEAAVRPTDLVGRYGGDEFVLLCVADAEQAAAIAARIERQIRAERIEWEGVRLHAGVSIGRAQARHADDETVEGLLREADRALYAAKLDGRDRGADGWAGAADD